MYKKYKIIGKILEKDPNISILMQEIKELQKEYLNKKGDEITINQIAKELKISKEEVAMAIDAENNVILVKGSVPGPKKSLVTIKESVKASK